MRKVGLNMKEQQTYEIIKNLVDNGGNKKRAAVILNCTVRNINILINKYQTEGKLAFRHKNANRKPKHTLSQDQLDTILLLYENKYYDANWNHFRQLLSENENINISYNCLHTLLTANGFLSPKAQRKTKKAKANKIREKINNMKKLTPLEEELVVSTNILDPLNSHPRVPRAKYFGEVLQMDASQHRWFNDIMTFLHGAIDDATGTVLALHFDEQETLRAYYCVLNDILHDYGIPYSFLTDKRTIFEYNPKKDDYLTKDSFTQFGYACKQLGIEIKTTSIAQKKGRIERLWNTLQSRLTVELRLAGITTIEEANEFLKSFIPKFNHHFALPINHTKSVFEKQPDDEKINCILAVISPRRFDNGSAIKFKNKYYQTYSEDFLICFDRHTSCLVIETFDDNLLCSVDEKIYELRELERNKSVSSNFDIDNNPLPKTRKVYIPPMSHPWKEASFMQYVNSQKHQKNYANV
jgi:transposase